MDQREKVSRAITRADYDDDPNKITKKSEDALWYSNIHLADAAIAAMTPVDQTDDEARWVVEQAVRVMSGRQLTPGGGKPMTFAYACDAIRAELLRVRTDLEGK